MIVNSAKKFGQSLQHMDLPAASPASPKGVFMVEPDGFFVSRETARDNHYMDLANAADPERAAAQFQKLAKLIRECGIGVHVFPGDHETPDAVFPNNAFGTIPGRLIIGEMLYPGRKKEAEREDISRFFQQQGYSVVDLRQHDCVAELTGVLILDRARMIGFCGMTHRVDEAGAAAMHDAFELNLTFCFDLIPDEYHTNVVMSVLAGRACVLHPEAFSDPDVPGAIAAAFPGRTLMLSAEEKNGFAGNCIALTQSDLFMSQAGADSLRPQTLGTLESWGFKLRTVNLDELEKAGGSLRCMVAEIF